MEFIKTLKDLKSNDPKQYWNILDMKNGKRKRNMVDVSLSSLFDHFKQLSEGQTTGDDDNVSISVEEINLDVGSLNSAVTDREIEKIVKKLKSGKAAGIDKITNEYIKTSITKLMPIYVHLFNKVLNSGVIPEDWSIGLIVPLFKKQGSSKDPNNYRGITLLSCIGKLFTMLINERLQKFIDTNNLLSENQAGFRKGYCTVDHIFLFKHIIELFRLKKQKLFCAFIDYQKAFDTVWRAGLWSKLEKAYSIKGKILNVIQNLYANVKSCVFCNGQKSQFFESLTGVRQGENLSPLLFSLYVNDLETYLRQKDIKALDFKSNQINNFLNLFIILYADDTVILSNNAKGLQQSLDHLYSYCNKWKLKVNPNKTKITIFGGRKVQKEKFTFKYNGKDLELVDEFKYLGVTFKYNGNFELCKKNLYEQASKAMFSLLSKCNILELPLDTQLELFDTMVVPIMTYGCEVWGNKNNEILEKLQLRFYRYILKVKNGTPNCMLYGELGRYPIDIIIKCRLIAYWHKLVTGNINKMAHSMYETLLNLYRNDTFKCDWLSFVHRTLNECGMSDVWITQGAFIGHNQLKDSLKLRLKDQFEQKWSSEINANSKCILYRAFKTKLEFEKYLVQVDGNYRKMLIKFRLCNHKLAVEKGRYSNIERFRRYCDLCNENILGDEFHTLLECRNSDVNEARKCTVQKYIKSINMFNFMRIMSEISDNRSLAINLGNFLMKLSKTFACI